VFEVGMRPSQPGFLPEKQARRFTAVMRLPTAAQSVKVHGVDHPARYAGLNRVACLVRALRYCETLSAILEHLWHERERIEFSLLVQGGEDLFFGAYFDHVAGTQMKSIIADNAAGFHVSNRNPRAVWHVSEHSR
jgi:hypothetical protein